MNLDSLINTTKNDPKKEEFLKYLEKNGAIDVLTKSLTELFLMEEKPSNPLDYFKEVFAGKDIEKLKKDNEELKKKLESK